MSKVKILLIEDDLELQSVVKRFLSNAGFDVTTANDGVDGLHRALSHPFGAIVCDVMMPYMDGYDLCSALRKDDRTKDTPLIVTTSENPDLGRRSADLFDAYFLPKPYRCEELLRHIGALVGTVANDDPA